MGRIVVSEFASLDGLIEDPGERSWPFTGGTIKRLAVDVSGEPYVDLERAAAAMIARE